MICYRGRQCNKNQFQSRKARVSQGESVQIRVLIKLLNLTDDPRICKVEAKNLEKHLRMNTRFPPSSRTPYRMHYHGISVGVNIVERST